MKTSSMKRKANTAAKTRYIRENHCYGIAAAALVTDVRPAQVRVWIRKGLPTLDGKRPYMIHGIALKGWLQEQQRSRRFTCAPNELPCFRCKAPKVPGSGTVTLDLRTSKVLNIIAPCPSCGTLMHKGASMSALGEVRAIFCLTQGGKSNLEGSAHSPKKHTSRLEAENV